MIIDAYYSNYCLCIMYQELFIMFVNILKILTFVFLIDKNINYLIFIYIIVERF